MKILKVAGLVLLILCIALFSIPFLFKGKIVSAIKQVVNEQVNAKVDFNESIGLSLISSFPNLELSIKDLHVINIPPFEGDTLFSAKELSIELDLMSIIRGESMQVHHVLLDKANINALINKEGVANWDITKPDTQAVEAPSSSSSAFVLKLSQLEVKESRLVYDDRQSDMRAVMDGVNYQLKGEFTESVMEMMSQLLVDELNFEMEGVSYFKKLKSEMSGKLLADMNAMRFEFVDHLFTLNALELGMNGKVEMPAEDIVMDIKWDAKKNDIGQFLSLIPAIYASDMNGMQTKGQLTLNGFVKGIYNDKTMPAFGLNLSLDNGWFKYSELPFPMEDLNIKLAIDNPDGEPDHTKINLEKLHWVLKGDVFDARLLTLTPVSDPFIDAFMKGTINLGNLGALAPMPEGTKLSGILKADVTAKGNLSTIEKEAYEDFDAKGNLNLKDMVYESADLPKPLHLNTMDMSFSPKLVALHNFMGQIGKSDMQMSGALENFYSYYLGDATLKGKLNFASKHFDANEFMSEAEDTAVSGTDTSAMTVVEVPDRIDFQLNSAIDKLNYSTYEITDFKGGLKIANRQIDFQNIILKLIGSSMKMNGYYETKDRDNPKSKLDFEMLNLDIQKAFKTFNTIQKLAPAAEQMNGIINTKFSMYTSFTPHMQPVYETLLAEGNLLIPQASISNIASINTILDFIAKPEYKQVSMTNANIAWKIINGMVYTQPFNVKLGKQVMQLGGTTSLSQAIDYTGTMNVPRKDLGEANNAINDALKQLNAGAGTNIKMDEVLPLVFKIGGTFTKPHLTTNIKELLASQAGSLKQQALNEAKRKAKELENKTRAEAQKQMEEAKAKAIAEAQKVKKEAEDKLNAEKERLRLEAEAKKKEAEAKAKAEADKLKKQAEEEAKKRLKGLLK